MTWKREIPEGTKTHRQFQITVPPTQIYSAFKDCLILGDYDEEKLVHIMRLIVQNMSARLEFAEASLDDNDKYMQCYRLLATAMHKKDIHYNILMWNFIKKRTEDAYVTQKKKIGRMK